MSRIYQIYGQDAHDMTVKLLEASRAHALVPAGGSVALKPNLVVAGSPDEGATTHAGVLSGCIEYFQGHGVKDISVIEGSWVGDQTMRAMRRAGYDKVCQRYDVPFFDLKKDVLKGHCQTAMTCALKNLKGCLPDREKRHFHAMGLQKPIAALAAVLKPGLIVVDSICGDLDFEEGGTPVQTNRMYLGTDAVQLDAYGRSLMGLNPQDVPYVELCEQYGGGSASWSEDDVVLLNHPSEAAGYPRPSGAVARLTKNVRENQACSACYAALVRALHTTRAPQSETIYIGQGWQGQALEGLGIGRCCKGATRCVMGCPPTAEAVANML